jgi:predicted nucleic acid-binding Zn ribbon protein
MWDIWICGKSIQMDRQICGTYIQKLYSNEWDSSYREVSLVTNVVYILIYIQNYVYSYPRDLTKS